LLVLDLSFQESKLEDALTLLLNTGGGVQNNRRLFFRAIKQHLRQAKEEEFG
jgi:hypothetical protein